MDSNLDLNLPSPDGPLKPHSVFRYSGPIYIKPYGRGITLTQPGGGDLNLNDALLELDGDYIAEISIRPICPHYDAPDA